MFSESFHDMSTLFIADLHLSPQELAITSKFLRFLQRDAIYADALYILGDLFEAWIGDDDLEPLYDEIAVALKTLQKSGVPCYFIHGNRDFLIGERFACASGMQLLPQENVLEIYGRHILILHGDTLCADDRIYQKFRSIVRHPVTTKLFLTLPLCLRSKIATKMRYYSKKANPYKPKSFLDVSTTKVVQAMLNHGVFFMIHGHTHLPAIQRLYVNKHQACRMALGCWPYEGSIIRVNARAIEQIPCFL